MKTHDDVVEYLHDLKLPRAVWEIVLEYNCSADAYFRWVTESLLKIGVELGAPAVFDVYAYLFFELDRLLIESRQPASERDRILSVAEQCLVARLQGSFTEKEVTEGLSKQVDEYRRLGDEYRRLGTVGCEASIAYHIKATHEALSEVLLFRGRLKRMDAENHSNRCPNKIPWQIGYGLRMLTFTCAMHNFVPFLVQIHALSASSKPVSLLSDDEINQSTQEILDQIEQTRKVLKLEIEKLIS